MEAEAAAPGQRRVFFALWPGAAVLHRLDQAGREAQQRCGGRRMRRETLHLTLAFIGNLPAQRISELEGIAGAIRAPEFELALDRIDWMARKKIVWAAASKAPEALLHLAADLNLHLKAADFRVEERPFAAHVTLLRNARCGGEKPEAAPVAWQVEDFVLVESELKPEGASYRIIGRWRLADQT
jgi:2'-5' RNA ligase